MNNMKPYVVCHDIWFLRNSAESKSAILEVEDIFSWPQLFRRTLATLTLRIHLFEAIDIPFQRAVTPRQCESSQDSGSIPSNTCDKRLKFTQLAGLNLLKPVLKLFACSLSEHVHESRY